MASAVVTNDDRSRVVAEILAFREASFSRDWETEATEFFFADNEVLLSARRAREARKLAYRDRDVAFDSARADAEREERSRVEAGHRAEVQRLELERMKAERDHVWPSSSIVIGVDGHTGKELRLDTAQFQHTLVGGMTGAGKTVWLHGLLSQLLKADTVERLVLIDLKKFEFARATAGTTRSESLTTLRMCQARLSSWLS